jgi:glycosyltransferase involved in cell wall biosynthesis
MRVLWATSNLPDPTLGGGPSLEHEWLRWAAEHHEVTLVTGGLADGDELPSSIGDLPLVEVVAAGAPAPRRPGRVGLLARSLAGPPWEFAVAQPRVGRVARAVAARPADLVHVMWAEAAPVAVASVAAGRRTAFFPSDSFARHARRRLAAADDLAQRVYWRLQLARTVAWERQYRRAGAVAVAAPVDARLLAEAGAATSVIPSPVAASWFEPPSPPVARDADLVTFVGALDYGPNVEAVRWLCADVWPRVAAGRPTARLHVVGRHPLPELVAAVEAVGGEVLADVPDVRPHYRRAGAVIVPIRLGSGLRTKVLHALACEAPLVATTIAIEGVDLEPGRDLLVADDAPGLAAAVLATLADPPAAAARAATARAVALAHHSDVVLGALAELWERA